MYKITLISVVLFMKMELLNYCVLILCVCNFIKSESLAPRNNIYGDDYGTKWIYFPDGEENVHYVNLTLSIDEYSPQIRIMGEGIEYRLYIRNDTGSYITLDQQGKPIGDVNENILNDLNISHIPLKVITHGWKSSVDSTGVNIIKNGYIKNKNVNVITVDWRETAESMFYHWVANEVQTVGARLALFLDQLHVRYNVTGQQIHLIGHSLGAHVMGIAASESTHDVDRVTGLDPARPLFEYPERENTRKLDTSDATFVDVIHTCAGVLGFQAAIGHADFYPNNGIAPQPGCDSIQKYFEACSHGRSYIYFAESIRYPESFPAYQCRNWDEFIENRCNRYGYMGTEVYRNMSGKYFLRTNSFEPFGLQEEVHSGSGGTWSSAIVNFIWNIFSK